MCSTKKGAFTGCGIALIVASVLMLIWQIANDVVLGIISLVVLKAVGYWAGILYLVVGILSAVAGRNLARGVIIGAFVMSIIVIVIGGLGSLIIYGQTAAVATVYAGSNQNNNNNAAAGAFLALWIAPIIFAVVCFILDICILVLTSMFICCGAKSDEAV